MKAVNYCHGLMKITRSIKRIIKKQKNNKVFFLNENQQVRLENC